MLPSTSCTTDNEPLSAKRTRSGDTANQTGQKSGTQFERSTKFWFEDGNIVIRVELMLFRVHRGVLARHSPVFQNAFALPQPAGEPKIEGCDVSNFPGDKAEDWENLFALIYDHQTDYKDEGDFKIGVLTSMLRLGHKYQLDVFYKAAMTRIRSVVPITLEEWTNIHSVCPDHLKNQKNAFGLLSIIVELGIEKLMPMLYYYCTSEFSQRTLATEYVTGVNTNLPPESVAKIITGNERLTRELIKNHLKWTTATEFPLAPSAKCGPFTQTVCNSVRHKALVAAFKNLDIRLAMTNGDSKFWTFFASDSWPLQSPLALCEKCANEVLQIQNRYRAWVWGNLPWFFDLPPWDSLQDL